MHIYSWKAFIWCVEHTPCGYQVIHEEEDVEEERRKERRGRRRKMNKIAHFHVCFSHLFYELGELLRHFQQQSNISFCH